MLRSVLCQEFSIQTGQMRFIDIQYVSTETLTNGDDDNDNNDNDDKTGGDGGD